MTEAGFNPFDSKDVTGNKSAICDCPICKEQGREGLIYEGSKTFYCSNSTEGNGRVCNFVLFKNNIIKLKRGEISAEEVNEVCEEGVVKINCTRLDGKGEYDGEFKLKPLGRYVGLEFTHSGRTT